MIPASGHSRQHKRRDTPHAPDSVRRATARLCPLPDEIVIGGGNLPHLKAMPEHCRAENNANAIEGGFRHWVPAWAAEATKRRQLDRLLSESESLHPRAFGSRRSAASTSSHRWPNPQVARLVRIASAAPGIANRWGVQACESHVRASCSQAAW